MGRNTTDPAAASEPESGTGVGTVDPPASNTLQSQLHEKERLIAALTERLEQAAEQLDRLRRTGADKGHRPLAGGSVPPELLTDQKQTLEELKKLVQGWEGMDAGGTLERIEAQVAEIRNMVASGVVVGGSSPAPAAPSAAAAPARERPAAAASASPQSEGKAAHSEGKGAHSEGKTSNSSWWEKQKAAMLGDSPPESEPAPAAPTPAAAEAPSAAEAEPAPAGASFSMSDVVIPDLPGVVDFETVTLEEAVQAIRVRDQLIQQLREPLLLLKAAGQLPSDLQSLDHLPAALRQKIEELEAHWQTKFRQTELDLSLERARMAREQSQLQQQQDQLQKQLKQSGRVPREKPEANEGEDGNSRRRWFRFMGKNEGDDASQSDK